MRRPYIVNVIIPKISRRGKIVFDPGVRDKRLREISLDLFNRFNERVHMLTRVGAVSLRMTEKQAESLTWHPGIKSIRLLED